MFLLVLLVTMSINKLRQPAGTLRLIYLLILWVLALKLIERNRPEFFSGLFSIFFIISAHSFLRAEIERSDKSEVYIISIFSMWMRRGLTFINLWRTMNHYLYFDKYKWLILAHFLRGGRFGRVFKNFFIFYLTSFFNLCYN